MALRSILILALACSCAVAQGQDAAYKPLESAYAALRTRSYADAISNFQRAIALAPQRASIRKDLAYTLLKVGENEEARDQFAEAMRIDPADRTAAMEYAFLCYETKQQAIARRVFDRIRKTGDPTAEQAFENIDRPLAEGIARWSKAAEISPDNFSAHQELATLAEQRDELTLAAVEYEKAWRLRPDERMLLVDLGRVLKALGRSAESNAALLAASRGGQPRAAEFARELLSARYPYPYEFENAIRLDPKNVELRREFAYLLLQMGKKIDAERQFEEIHKLAPGDLLSAAQLGFLLLARGDKGGAQPLLSRVLAGGDSELSSRVRAALGMPPELHAHAEMPRSQASAGDPAEAKTLAEKSLKAGYLKDALKYLTVAHEADPVDFGVMLKMGWTYNILHQDEDAIRWFDLARKSPDPAIAKEASQAYKNLRPSQELFKTTVWFFPFYSSRWKDAFGYGQMKTELNLGKLPFRVYASARLTGDIKRTTDIGYLGSQYLSEDSVIFGLGAASLPWHGATGWFEAGESVKYLPNRADEGAAIPDYRGGISYGKGFGHLLNGSHGFYAETNDDGVYVSRFQQDKILYSQNRAGYTFAQAESFGGLQAQIYWNFNGTADWLSQYWANFVETGPGIKFRAQALPNSMLFSINFLRGVYTVNSGNPRGPNFFDLRAGVWYAFSR